MGRVPITVRIDSELNDWIKSEFPHGFKQLFLEKVLHSLKDMIYDGRSQTTSQQARLATAYTVLDAVGPHTQEEEED